MKLNFFLFITVCIPFCGKTQTNIFPTNGNVGIGTTAPAANLNVVSAPNNTISAIKIGKANDPGKIEVPYGEAAGGYNIDFAAWRDVRPDYIGARIRGERMNTWGNNSALVQSMDLVFSTGGPADDFPLSEQLRIKYNGNIGIGTRNPQEKLSVKGRIRAQEVKVETANWPDYVFSPGYQLPSLSDTEKFIQVNGHLPEVPKAAEVEANGVSLGEMNKILLKKIEELTLQAIADEKMRSRQQELIEQQSKAILSLEQRLGRLETIKNNNKVK